MALELERKFLVNSLPGNLGEADHIVQMYLVDKPDHSLRIRIINDSIAKIGYKYYLSCEAKEEFEFHVPLVYARERLKNQEYVSVLKKLRYHKDGWDIDVYTDGLILAEFEFSSIKLFPEELPSWIGNEVTGLMEYSNPVIARRLMS